MSQDQNTDGAIEDDFLIRLSEVIRHYRKVKGISQEQLAEQSGLHRTYISDIERGARNIAILNLRRIARALGIRVSQLISDVEDLSVLPASSHSQPAKN